MAIRILNEADLSASALYVELRLDIDVTERSWSSSDPFEELIYGIENKLDEIVFNEYKLEGIISKEGYTIQDMEVEEIEDGSIFKKQDGAFSSRVIGYTVRIAEEFTPREAQRLASIIYEKFPIKEKAYSLVGIPIDGYHLTRSDLDEQDAEIDCRIITLSIASNGKNVYFD